MFEKGIPVVLVAELAYLEGMNLLVGVIAVLLALDVVMCPQVEPLDFAMLR